MLLQITHETRYAYTPMVETAQHMAYLRPNTHAGQSLLSHSLDINPLPAHIRTDTDVYGNTRCFFSLHSPHSVLQVVAHSLVATYPRLTPSSQLPWEAVRAQLEYRATAVYDSAAEFVFASPHVPRHESLSAYAQPSALPGASVLAVAEHLMQRIHADFTYASQSTEINTPAVEALAQRRGVCQDFAHIMVACLRSLGLPARYVSGYLLTQAAPGMQKMRGSDASHAWVSVYVPDLPEGSRWCDFDPTNQRWGWNAPGEDYVSVATGRDFSDVSPLRGVIHGGASHTLQVGVTVEALATTAAPAVPTQPTQTQFAWGQQVPSDTL